MKDSLEVKLASALLEEVLEGLAKKIHNHNVVHLSVIGLLVADEVEERHEGLAAKLVNELALPEKHDMSLHLDSFLLHTSNKQGGKQVICIWTASEPPKPGAPLYSEPLFINWSRANQKVL